LLQGIIAARKKIVTWDLEPTGRGGRHRSAGTQPPNRCCDRNQESGLFTVYRRKQVFFSLAKWAINKQMKKFTAIVHQGEPDEGGPWATCLEVPGANGQGDTNEKCLTDLKNAIQLLIEAEREEAFRLAPDAETAELVLA
jgi:predicted RNase H-like HicB family nuclease